MTDHAKLIEDAQRFAIKQTSWTETREVLWGNASGQFIVQAPIYPREVYWHSLSTENQEVGVAILDADCNILYQENAAYAANPPRIIIGKPPKSELWHVQGGSKSLEGAQAQGSLSSLEQLAQLSGNPSIFNLLDLRVRPTDAPSTSIYVEAGIYEKPSAPGVKQRWLGGTEDLASAITALTSGQHQLAVIILDTESGALTYSTTAPVSAVGSLPSRLELTSISSITLSTGQEAVGTIYLYYGQTAIEASDWLQQLDPRLTGNPGVGVQSVVAGTNVTVDNTDPQNPVVSASPGGGGVATSLLNYVETTDVFSGTTLVAATWTDVLSNQTFTVTNGSALIEFSLVLAMFVGCAVASNIGVRLVIDSGGTPINVQMAPGRIPAGDFGAPPGGVAKLSGLSAAAHTVKVQVILAQSGGNNGTMFLQALTVPDVEGLRLQVTQL